MPAAAPIPAAPPPASNLAWRWLVAGALLVALAIGLRVRGILSPMWLDELWTLLLLDRVRGFLAVLTELHHDNNHVLNSWFLLAMRGHPVEWLMRLPHLLFSLSALGLAAWMLARRQRDWRAGIMGLAVLGLNYLLVDLGSQARGYALVLAPALGCWWLARETWLRPTTPAEADAGHPWGYAALAILGTLAHPLMLLQVLLPLGLWQVSLLARQRAGWPAALAQLVRWQLPAGLFSAWFYWSHLRVMAIGNQTDRATWEALAVLQGLGSQFLGWPASKILGLAVFLLLLAWLAWEAWRAPTGDEVFWLLVLLVPSVYIAITQPVVLATRYFALPLQFLLWVLARTLWLGWQAGGRRRLLAAPC